MSVKPQKPGGHDSDGVLEGRRRRHVVLTVWLLIIHRPEKGHLSSTHVFTANAGQYTQRDIWGLDLRAEEESVADNV